MAITKIPSGKYQVKIIGTDGKWLTKTFITKRDAEEQEANWKQKKRNGVAVSGIATKTSLNEFFQHWSANVPRKAAPKWKKDQTKLYSTYIAPLIGNKPIDALGPMHIGQVFQNPWLAKKTGSTQRHVFIILRRLFQDAIEIYRLITFNPVLRKFKPDVPQMETAHLNVEELKNLLHEVKDKPYGTAIWLQLFLGLRVGELQALRWQDIDLISSTIYIRQTFVTHEWEFKNYPKGKKQHSHQIPNELRYFLTTLDKTTEFVAVSPDGGMVTYKQYLKHLKAYCKDLGITKIGTHGLRHSTSTIYMNHGATKDDLQQLFAHSSPTVTERYLHHRGTHLEKIAKEIQLFPQNFHGADSVERNDSTNCHLSVGNDKKI